MEWVLDARLALLKYAVHYLYDMNAPQLKLVHVVVAPAVSRNVIAAEAIKKSSLKLIPTTTAINSSKKLGNSVLPSGFLTDKKGVKNFFYLRPKYLEDEKDELIVPFWHVQSTPIPSKANMKFAWEECDWVDPVVHVPILYNTVPIKKGDSLLFFSPPGTGKYFQVPNWDGAEEPRKRARKG